jgi:hypothetical protein
MAFSCGARSAFKLSRRKLLEKHASRCQLEGFIGQPLANQEDWFMWNHLDILRRRRFHMRFQIFLIWSFETVFHSIRKPSEHTFWDNTWPKPHYHIAQL